MEFVHRRPNSTPIDITQNHHPEPDPDSSLRVSYATISRLRGVRLLDGSGTAFFSIASLLICAV